MQRTPWVREASYIDLSTRNVIWMLGGGGVGACDVSRWKTWKISIVCKFVLIFWNHRYKVHKIQHFHKCICILSIFLCSLSGPAPSVLLYVYTQHSILKFAKLIMPHGPHRVEKLRNVSKGGGVGGLQKNVHMTFLMDKIDMWRFPYKPCKCCLLRCQMIFT